MKRFMFIALGLLVYSAGQPVRAQEPYARPAVSPFARPAVSPYLNLSRPGSPAVNYFDLVRPQQEVRSSIHQLQTATSQLATSVADPAPPVVTTGHPTRFMNYSQYFNNLGGPGPATPRTTPAPVTASRPRRPGF